MLNLGEPTLECLKAGAMIELIGASILGCWKPTRRTAMTIIPNQPPEDSGDVAASYWGARLAGLPDFLAIQAAAYQLERQLPMDVSCSFQDVRLAIVSTPLGMPSSARSSLPVARPDPDQSER